jgi:hypothetical protein
MARRARTHSAFLAALVMALALPLVALVPAALARPLAYRPLATAHSPARPSVSARHRTRDRVLALRMARSARVRTRAASLKGSQPQRAKRSAVVRPTLPATPAGAHPTLILSADDLDAIRAHIVANDDPWARTYANFRLWSTDRSPSLPTAAEVAAMKGLPDLDGVQRPFFDHISNDGARTRNWALLYHFSGGQSIYRDKVRQFLLAWARGYTPIGFAYTPDDNGDPGYLQAFGAFSFAYAYDLLYDQFSSSERQELDAWFSALAKAQRSNTTQQVKTVASLAGRDLWEDYSWSLPDGRTLRYARYQHELGGNFVVFPVLSAVACAEVADCGPVLDWAFDGQNQIAWNKVLEAMLNVRNEGDGVTSHGVPVPAMYVNKVYVAGRGGAIDYCTYNARLADVMLDMAPGLRLDGRPALELADVKDRLAATWTYLARFFGPGAEPAPMPGDKMDMSTSGNLPRFVEAYHDLGGKRLLAVADSGDLYNYYEPQLLGPVTLTHWPR